MPPTKVLEAFVKLFADDAELRKTFAGLEGGARKAGTAAGLSFSEGLNQSIAQNVTPKRVGDRGFVPPTVGGRGVDLGSPFSRGFQQFKTARELATIGPGGIVPGGGGPGGGGGFGRGAGGGGLLGGGGLAQISRAAGFGGIGARLGLLANPATAIPAAALSAVTLYAKGVKAATDAERELARSRDAGDLEGVVTIFQKASAAVREYDADVLAASDTAPGLEAATRRALAGVSIAFQELTGRGIKQLQKEADAAKKAASDMWEAFGRPQLAVSGIKRQGDELARTAEIALKAAADTMSYNAAVDLLVKAKQRQADAERRTIEIEKGKILEDRNNKIITEAEAVDKLADANERLGGVQRKLGQDLAQVERDRRQKLAEMDAAEIDHTAAIEQLQRERRDSIVSSLGEVLEIEAQANLSLKQTFAARQALQAETTKNALESLKAETAARRASLTARLGGAQGEERVKIERELTILTEQENAKRTQIEVRAAADRIRLARQTQQELIAQTEQIFAIQRTLGQRSLRDDLDRFASTAAGARAGSKVQLDALAKVAASAKALADQARQFLGEALAASDRLAQSRGLDPSAFVSLTQLAQDAADEMTRLEEAQRTLAIGGEISRADFQALAGGQLERLRSQADAGRSATAADLARLSVDSGQGIGAFQAGLGGAGGLGTRQGVLGAQLGEAFSEPADIFRRSVGGMTDALDGLVKSVDSDFKDLETIVDRSMTAIEQRVQRASSTVRTSLKQAIKTDIARELDRDLKTY